MGELINLHNIGKDTERQLNAIGINTVEEFIKKGSKQAWLDIKAIDPSACYNRLCGLEGAIQGRITSYNVCYTKLLRFVTDTANASADNPTANNSNSI